LSAINQTFLRCFFSRYQPRALQRLQQYFLCGTPSKSLPQVGQRLRTLGTFFHLSNANFLANSLKLVVALTFTNTENAQEFPYRQQPLHCNPMPQFDRCVTVKLNFV